MNKAEELLLHIGHGKTGTTTLQNTLFQSRDALREQGVLMPEIHPGRGNALLLGYFLFGHTDADGERQRWLKMDYPQLVAASAQAWRDIQEMVSDKPPKTLLISSELFFRPMSASTLKFANQQVAQVAEASRVVSYIRAPDSLFLSHIQEILKHFLPYSRPSRTTVRDTIRPFMNYWDGPVSLEIFDRTLMEGDDVVGDFLAKHLPDIDASDMACLLKPMNASVSAEAMSILYEFLTDQRQWHGNRHILATEVIKADKRIENPTKPKARPGVAEAIINWRAPDLFWMRDEQGLIFPGIDYDAIDPDDIDDAILRIGRIEDICEVNPDRKAMLLRRATFKAKLPSTVRRWLAKY